jgi:hypothetical protein
MTFLASNPTSYTLEDFRGSRSRMREERIVRAVLFVAASTSIVISAAIVASLIGEAWTFVSQVELATLWTDGWFPRRGMYDIKTLVSGSLIVTVIAMALAGPLGLCAAIYLSEYAPAGVRKVVKPALEILAGIPSVVLGFFALTFLSPVIVQRLNDEATQFNIAAAGIGVGILTWDPHRHGPRARPSARRSRAPHPRRCRDGLPLRGDRNVARQPRRALHGDADRHHHVGRPARSRVGAGHGRSHRRAARRGPCCQHHRHPPAQPLREEEGLTCPTT